MKNIVFHSIPVAIAMGLLGSASALAQDASTMYAGISYSQIDFDEIDEKPAMVVGIVGWPVGENFSIEGRFGTGVKGVKDSEFINGRVVTAELKVNTNVGVSASDSESSEAYGVGAEFVFGRSKSNHLAFEWARYFEETNAISVIYRLKF
jgi:hypothetical protein